MCDVFEIYDNGINNLLLLSPLGQILLSYMYFKHIAYTVVGLIITRMGYVLMSNPNCSSRDGINSCHRFDLLPFRRFDSICRNYDRSCRIFDVSFPINY